MATREDSWDASNCVRLCDRCNDEQGAGMADEGDRACAACGNADAPHIYPPLHLLASTQPSDGRISVSQFTELRDDPEAMERISRAINTAKTQDGDLPRAEAAVDAVFAYFVANRSPGRISVEFSEEMVEAAAEALHDEQERRDPSGEYEDIPHQPWQPDSPPPREPLLWAQMVEEGKYPSTQEEFREDARAALRAALTHNPQGAEND